MNRFPSPIPKDKMGIIPLYADIGVDLLLNEVYKSISPSIISNQRTSDDIIKKFVGSWILGFETNPDVINERQAIMEYALRDPEFINVIDNLGVYPTPNERMGGMELYEGMSRRFDTFAESLSSIVQVLRGKEKPKTLTDILNSCEEIEKKTNEARAHINPEFELRVEMNEEKRKKGFFTMRYGNVYVLVNKSNNSVKRDCSKVAFGLHPDHLDRDSFLESLEDAVETKFKSILGLRRLFRRLYQVDGVAEYNQEDYTINGLFGYAIKGRKKRRTFSVSDDHISWDSTPKSIIEIAGFRHNYQVINPFEETMHDFEDLVVGLKAISATTHFLKHIRDKEYPLTFPKRPADNSNIDIYIKEMYHPLLVYFSKRGDKVVPNDVETTLDKNVRLITGANNNGKTCYKDAFGLSQCMYQGGLPIVAMEAIMRVKDEILTHYVRPGDIKASQSRFAHECARVLELIQNISNNSLILCDELFTGTAPQDGEIVSKLVLDKLIATGATLFFTTHYHNLGNAFRDSQHVVQLCCKLDHSTNPPSYTYKIQPGISRDSDGLVVASQYGVNNGNLNALLTEKSGKGLRLR